MKKNNGYILLIRDIGQILRIMKIAAVLTFILSIHSFANSYGQAMKINISMENATFGEVVERLEKESGFYVVIKYDQNILEKKINVNFQNATVPEILDQMLLNTGLGYKIIDKYIAISSLSEISNPSQQQRSISGKVSDSSGADLPGVSVVVKGTTNGVTSDGSGKFVIGNIPANAILQFSFIGMKMQEIATEGKTSVNIVMVEETIGVEEVVVIGYGTQKKADITGSVSLVTNKDLEKIAVVDPMQALQGKSAGVNITSVSGQPGAGYQIQIRGIQSYGASSAPIYVIDGVISDNMYNIDANDIESVSILKDGASSAIYGTRAANGVVLITTKQGVKNQAPLITFHTYQGVQSYSNRKMTLLNSNQWLQLNDESLTNDGLSGAALDAARGYTNDDLQIYKDANGNYRNTDWLKQISQTGRMQYYDLAISGGSEKSTYYTSLSYLDQDGLIISQLAKKLNFRFNSVHKINKFIEFGNNMYIYSNGNEGLPDANAGGFSYNANPYLQAIRKSPLSRPTEADGSYGINLNQNVEYVWMPPTVITNEYKRTSGSNGVAGNFYLKFNLATGLTFTSKAGITYDYSKAMNFIPGVNIEGTVDGQKNTSLSKYSGDSYHWQTDYLFNYDHTFNKVHNLSVLAGYSQEEQKSESMGGSRNNIPLNTIYYLNAGDPATMVNSNGFSEWTFASYLGRVNYDYSGKYLLQATVRRDGSSRFSTAERWGVFPSVSAGWRMSKENFFKSLTHVVNDFKIRGGIGTLGNANIGNYPTYTSLSALTAIINEQKSGGYTLTGAINKDVRWETTRKYNIGFDASLLESKIYLTADYFISKTTDLLYMKPLPMSAGKDAGASPYVNGGEMQNKGWEAELGYREKKGDFSYDVSANLSTVHNKMVDLAGQDINGLREQGTIIGQPFQSYYGLSTNGIIKTQAQLDAYKASLYTDVANGDFHGQLGDVFKKDIDGYDANGNLTGKPDGKIDGADRTITGKKYADFAYGFSGNLSYKRFSLQIQAQGVQGISLPFTGTSLNYPSGIPMNSNNVILERWNATLNPNGNLSRVTRLDPNKNAIFSDAWLSDASFLRINNVNISYDLPDYICQKLLLKNLKVYCSIQNLYTFTKFKGVEPDATYISSYNGGTPADKIPQPRTWIGGIKFTF